MSVFKKILILLLSSFVGIIANPELPFASDTVAVTGITGEVETVIEIAPEPAEVETVLYVAKPAPTPTPASISALAPVSVQPNPAPAPMNQISIAGRTLSLVHVDSTAVDAGNHVNKYGEKFLYGHNSAGVFGVLYNVGVGEAFSVTENGVTRNYRVQAVVIYEKVDDYTLKLNGQTIKMAVVARARYSGVNYDLSLMTCYGTSYGNGDASHRLVLFASAI